MGQAFDKYGHVLGEAFGETKADVFNELMKKHPDANELRIKTIDSPAMELPKYRCHKVVHALKLSALTHEPDGGAKLIPAEEPYAPFAVDAEYVKRHRPQPGGYYVVYDDGYTSFSPAKAFEDGYTKI